MIDLYADYIRLAGQSEFEYWTSIAARELLFCKLIAKHLGVGK